MVLCNVEIVEKISQYLDIPELKAHMSANNVVAVKSLGKNQSIEGFCTIVQALALKSNKNVLGNDEITRAMTYQWLEYIAVCVNYADVSKNSRRVLKELNLTLKNSSYMTGTTKTIADVAMYYVLHSIMRDLANQEKAEFVHVSRWFDNIQQDEKTRQSLDFISFIAASLYLLNI